MSSDNALKMIYFFLLIFSLSSFTAEETVLKGKVVDTNGQAVHLALVFNSDLSIGAYTDENGEFILITNAPVPELEVFALGFSRKRIEIGSDPGFLNIRLENLTHEIEEIIVKPCPKVEFTIGVEEGAKLSITLGSSSRYSYQAGKSLPTSYGQEITAVDIHVVNDQLRPGFFRLRIYELDSIGVPGKDILIENVIVRVPRLRLRRPLQVDLTDYNLRSPETGIFVAMEWLPGEQNLQSLTSRDSEGKRLERKMSIIGLGLVRTAESPEYKMWSKRDEGEWYDLNIILSDFLEPGQVNLPAIRVHLRDCD